VIKPPTNEPSDRELIGKVAAGSEDALRALNRRYGGALVALAERVVGSRADAEEVAADVLWQIWRQAERFDPARGSAGAWIMTLARSRAIDRVRARNARIPGAVTAEPAEIAVNDDPAPQIYSRECRQVIGTAMENLPRPEREVLELAYYSELSQTEIAERTGMPLGTVKTRVRGALTKLRAALKGMEG